MVTFLQNIKEKLKKLKNRLSAMFRSKTFRAVMLLGTAAFIFILVFCGGLYILFKPYTITFDLGNGKEPVYYTYDINSGAINLGIPVRKGYRFTGWTGSNGSKPKREVTVGNGKIGDLTYKANWSKNLHVICQDWLIDANGDPVKDITEEVDRFLKSGKSSKKYKVVDRTLEVKVGETVNAEHWGKDTSVKAYSANYVYVKNSGDVKVKRDETVVYRYFYPVLDVNYLIDEMKPADKEMSNAEVAHFDMVVDGKTVASDVADYYKGVPAGSHYEIVIKDVNTSLVHEPSISESGIMGYDKNNIDVLFSTRGEGEFKVTCQDWVVNSGGVKVQEITDHVDSFLAAGNSTKKYKVQQRTISVNYGEVLSGQLWGGDATEGAYANGYVYVGCSDPVAVIKDNVVVYRYFYPVLDINASINDKTKNNLKGIGRMNVYIDDVLTAENVTEFNEALPAGTKYRVEMTDYDMYQYVHHDTVTDSGTMGYIKRELNLRFEERKGSDYAILEDWIVDQDGNMVRNITEEVDDYLSSDENKGGYKVRSRMIKADAGSIIDASLFGNDVKRGAYSLKYVYAGSSGETEIGIGGTKIYRYFWPVLDVNGTINGKDKGTTKKAAIFNVYVNGVMVRLNSYDFAGGVPVGARYEVGMIRPQNDYVYTPVDNAKGIMTDEYTDVRLILDKRDPTLESDDVIFNYDSEEANIVTAAPAAASSAEAPKAPVATGAEDGDEELGEETGAEDGDEEPGEETGEGELSEDAAAAAGSSGEAAADGATEASTADAGAAEASQGASDAATGSTTGEAVPAGDDAAGGGASAAPQDADVEPEEETEEDIDEDVDFDDDTDDGGV